jgi:CRISPR-associated protein Cas2
VVRGQEVLTFVIYDIVDDLVRGRVANACKDYGLERIQYSAFSGSLDATRRNELATRLADTLGTEIGRILVLPVCEKDVRSKRDLVNAPTGETGRHG